MQNKSTKIIFVVILLLIIVGAIYWYLFFYGKGTPVTPIDVNPPTNGFRPLNGGFPTNNGTSTSDNGNFGTSTDQQITETTPMPALRLLSNTPIGGYGASTTANTTVVRWVDRGRGNVLEARGDSLEITTLSNTILPRTYQSVWNKNISAFIGSLLPAKSDIPTVIYAQLKAQSTSTLPVQIASNTATTTLSDSSSNTQAPNITPYALKGKNLPENMIDYAVSPKGDKVFMLTKENNGGTGYISNFDGTSVVKIFTTPLTQVNVEWPEETTIAITTKGSSSQAGFLYFVNTKTGIWKKVVGPIFGLSTKVSRNAKYVIASGTTKDGSISTNLYSVGTSTPTDATIKTLADKCVWGNFYKELVYCAVPSQIESAIYPDDWYKGSISFVDKIWQINAVNGEVHLVSSIINQSNRVIDVFNLGLDTKDDFLFFMNKNDLSFWSLDLNAR